MAKERKKGSGRPKTKQPKNHQIAFRIDDEALAAVGKMRERIGVLSFSVSDTAREMLLRALRQEGLL